MIHRAMVFPLALLLIPFLVQGYIAIDNVPVIVPTELDSVGRWTGFVPNRGQWSEELDLVSETCFGHIGITGSSLLLDVRSDSGGSVIRMWFPNSRDVPAIGLDGERADSTFILGSDPSRWVTTNTVYGSVLYEDLWSGIDLAIAMEGPSPKYEFRVDPGADPNVIVIGVQGHRSLSVCSGSLEIGIGGGHSVIDAPPFAYQPWSDEPIEAEYRIMDDSTYSFTVSEYDPEKALIIDPLLYSTFVGGGGWDQGKGIKVGEDGSAYIVGHTDSMDFPTTIGSYDEDDNGGVDVYVAKLGPGGSSLEWCTFFGGSSNEYGQDLYLGNGDDITFCGYSNSEDLPVTSDAFDGSHNGLLDGFVARISSDGKRLLYSTYIGGRENDYLYGAYLDHIGASYFSGGTYSPDIPTTEGAFQRSFGGGSDAMVMSFESDMRVRYLTYIGGSMDERAYDVAVDLDGSAYVCGNTMSSDFPVTSGCLDAVFDDGEAFLSCMNWNGTELMASTFLGGSGYDTGNALALTRTGLVVISGRTSSPDLQTSMDAFDRSFNGFSDVFVSGLKEDLDILSFSTFIGGADYDEVYGMDVDGTGNIILSGSTRSTDYPVSDDALSSSHSGGTFDGTLSILDPDVTDTLYSTYVGGTSTFDYLYDVATDDRGRAFAVGNTASSDHPTTSGSYDTTFAGDEDVIVLSFDPELPCAPGTPTNLSAVSKDEGISLEWDPPAMSGTGPLTGYVLLRGDGPYSLSYERRIGDSTTYTDTGLEPGKTYHYVLIVENALGRSRPSSLVSVDHVVRPSPPMDIKAVGGPDHVIVSWSAPFSDGGSPLTGFDIWRCESRGEFSQTANVPPEARSFNDTDVVPGVEYGYEIISVSSAGRSVPSERGFAIPMARPGPPVDLRAIEGDGFVRLSWAPPSFDGGSSITGYSIYRIEGQARTSIGTVDGATLSFNDTQLENGLELFYGITAWNKLGEGPLSSIVNVVPAGPPDPPYDLVAIPGDQRVDMTWSLPVDDGGSQILSIVVLREEDDGETEIVLGPSWTSYSDTDVTNGRTYRYSVIAMNAKGSSAREGPIEVTPIGPPDPPRNVRMVKGDGWVAISWEPPVDDGGSPVESYSLLRGISGYAMTVIGSVGSDRLSFNDTSVKNGIDYRYAIRSICNDQISRPSEELTVTPLGRPGPATDLSVRLEGTRAYMTWSPPVVDGGIDPLGYRLYRTVAGAREVLAELGPGNLSYEDHGLPRWTSVGYDVVCFNPIGDGPATDTVGVEVQGVPGPVPGIEAEYRDGRVLLTWNAPGIGADSVSFYMIYRRTDGSGPVLLGMTQGPLCYFEDSAPRTGTSVYEVKPVNGFGAGDPESSNEVSIEGENEDGRTNIAPIVIGSLFLIVSLGVLAVVLLYRKR